MCDAKCNIAQQKFLFFVSFFTNLALWTRWEPSSLHSLALLEEFAYAP